MSYDPAVALDFFKAAGKPTAVKQTQLVFAENETNRLFQRSKIYLVVDGEVSLVAGKKVLGTVKKGEIFGELAALTHAPRTATAVAKTDATLIALDEEEFEKGLEKTPAFALMMMSMLIGRLRETIAKLTAAGKLAQGAEPPKESAAFDRRELNDLVRGLANDPPIYYQQGRQIMSEGSKAVLMYAVLQGRVAISIGGRVVERLGPCGAFGEAALVDQAPRMASAVAEIDSELQPITRQAFLTLVRVSPKFAHKVLASLAKRLRVLTEQLK